MRKVLSYGKSHIYDIHAFIVAVITIMLMNLIKRYLKPKIKMYVEKRAEVERKWYERKEQYLKRCNMVLIVLAMVLAFVLFGVLAFVSPMILFSVESAVMSGVFALTGYAFLEQMTYDI